jgi:catechol 2,3-dioxygenase-like lactoylglutathione lyase family enzyme
MVGMRVNHVFAGVPVADFVMAQAWYERLFGGQPDLVPHDTEAAWRLAGDLCWVYVVADPIRAGNALLTVLVDDLDARIAELASRGIATGQIEAVNGMRRTVVRDPEGNTITYAATAGDSATA